MNINRVPPNAFRCGGMVPNPIEHRMAALLASPYASLWRTAGSWEWLTANEIWSVR